ncbi:cob(I)yrinic acid a,c-diamide adenosyltransferase [Candidatus Nomurabacteria bacterium]|nr:cob(I)yrinic acid a,c-diamide adenosyltransferase [Candidatus Saccharibacteria bacterium]MCA9350693.1 cob(I)yrinic acid a,c-diamide adenosyltransferase [Candidatus Saccharibacteria bacterium]MCB9839690.1 cob(I)yrinic acid a,c-diamide adenosyltransferase [Candidatus Nomurabacteria bacterium]
MFDDYKTKKSVVVVYTGEGKGKTSASLGLMARALGANWKIAYIQFIKSWQVNEHHFINEIMPIFKDKLFFYKGGAGFYHAGELSAKGVSDQEHKKQAQETYKMALACARSGEYDLVICDEINNAVNDGLLKKSAFAELTSSKHDKTSLCLTGRNYPATAEKYADIITNMTKVKHHFDKKYLANNGIDY